MAENAEEIEAKLAAYVDGELTPAERVEIETHLQNNPSHRALLLDLVQHRNLLRGLPREKAPVDCTEGFQGQLERDILLGGDELSRARRRWRIQYSPQLLSAAAIILVAVALGIIVYAVLPPHQSPPPVAQLTTEPAKNDVPLSDGMTVADARSHKGGGEVMAKRGAPNGSLALTQDALDQQVDATRYAGFKTQAEEPIALGDMMIITVTADDVKSANEAVVNYLALNKITYTAEAQDALKDGLATLTLGRRLAAGGMAVPGGAGGGNAGGGAVGETVGLQTAQPAQVPALKTNVDEVAKRDENFERKRETVEKSAGNVAFKAEAPQDRPLAEQIVTAKTEPQREERFAQAAGRLSAPQPEAKAPSTQPTAIAANDPGALKDTVNGKFAESGSASASTLGGAVLFKQQQQLRGVQQLADEDGAACVILARNMNGQQVRDLARSLSQPERNLYARVQLERSDAYRQTALTTLARSSDQKGKEHFLADQQKAVPEQDVMLREKEVVANAAAVVGPTTRPAEAALAIKPAEAGLNRAESDPAQKVAVASNVAPNDFAFIQPAQQPQVPSQQQGYFAIAPTTQPESARGGRELFTCVIVVQNNTANLRAGAATTQPVAGKPTTAPAAAQPDVAK